MPIGIDFNEYDFKNPQDEGETGLAGWIMAHSGGKITTKQQAMLIMLIIAGIATVLSLYLLFGFGTNSSSQSGESVIDPATGELIYIGNR